MSEAMVSFQISFKRKEKFSYNCELSYQLRTVEYEFFNHYLKPNSIQNFKFKFSKKSLKHTKTFEFIVLLKYN